MCERPFCEACDALTKSSGKCMGCDLEKGILEEEVPQRKPHPPPVVKSVHPPETGKKERSVTARSRQGSPYPFYAISGQYEEVERGIDNNFPVYHPDASHWSYAEYVLQDFIRYTSSDVSTGKPHTNYKYLVGRMVYPDSYPVITDYMLSYEEDVTGCYSWVKYITTYYHRPAFVYDANVFYPAPLPLALSYYGG